MSMKNRLDRAASRLRPGVVGEAHRMRGGFTLVELMMGIVVTSLVMGALAAFTSAMTQNWSESGDAGTIQMRGAVVTARISDILRNAMAVGAVWPGSTDPSSTAVAGVMLWMNDGLAANGKIEWGEAGWLEYDPTTHVLQLYQCASSLNFMQKVYAKHALSPVDFRLQTMPEAFKSQNYITSHVVARGVLAASFTFRDSNDVNGRPSVEYVITLSRNDQQEVCYGNAALRGATTPAN